MINLCEDRLNFLLAFGAALFSSHTTLLPASRARQVIAEVEVAYAGSYRFGDEQVRQALQTGRATGVAKWQVHEDLLAMIGFTTGTTGRPQAHRKTWRSVLTSSKLHADAIRSALHLPHGLSPWIVATVPSQHMYGMDLSVLLPLLGGMAVHSGRPLFPADVVQALANVPQPRILVSTPVHLRALVESGLTFPPLAGVISATAPLDAPLAKRVEERLATTLFEMFGSTETSIFATRRTAHEAEWRLYPAVELTCQPDGTRVSAPWLEEPALLHDIVEILPNRRFVVCGRNSDLIEIAGKRGSLADLTRRLLAVEGVRDAIVFPPEHNAPGQIHRVAALVVCPGLDASTVIERLSVGIDPAFLPRPLIIVNELPRNETGKLPRERLLEILRSTRSQ
jgi:acyl-coenzyme A synthetase/AMP-(fatty) acid ligase